MQHQPGGFIPDYPVDDAFRDASKSNPYLSEGTISVWKAELQSRFEQGVEPMFDYLSFLTNSCGISEREILKQFGGNRNIRVALDTLFAENKGLLPVVRKFIEPKDSGVKIRYAV